MASCAAMTCLHYKKFAGISLAGGIPAAIGKRINVMNKLCPIVGVVRDFHTKSLREPISPIVMTNGKRNYGLANIKIAPDRLKESISTIESVWNEMYPDYVFGYSFIDQTIAEYYKQETQLSLLFKIFAGIAILISCLGVYGLVSFMVIKAAFANPLRNLRLE